MVENNLPTPSAAEAWFSRIGSRVGMILVAFLIASDGLHQKVAAVPISAGMQEVESPLPDELTEPASEPQQVSLLRMMLGSNLLGYLIVAAILLLSVLSLYFIIEHSVRITRQRLMPDKALSELERLIANHEVNKAIELCRQREHHSLATEVVLAGLQRYQGSEFGYAEYRSAVEEAGEDQTGKLYRRTEVLNLIAAIAPMLGLTGTVVGMIDSFMTMASLEGSARPQQLAGGIGQALITTLLGLMVAIPSMIALSYFRNRIDSLVSEAGQRIERVMMPLGRRR